MELTTKSSPPLLVRIAGLPATAMEAFTSDLCSWLLANRMHLQTELDQLRSDILAILHETIPNSPPDLRRFLLSVRRDCFNARALAGHQDTPHWARLRCFAGPVADCILQLEDRLTSWQAEFDEAYHR